MLTHFFSINKLSLILVLAGLLLLLIVGSALSAQVELLNDGFENTVTPFANWDGNGTANWSISNSIYHGGTHSARGNHGANNLSSDDLDTSDAVSIGVDFWFRKTDLTSSDFTLFYCYGADICNLIAELDGLGPDDTWLHYTETITDSQYFTSTFYIRFEGPPPPSERVFVDDVLITKDTGETLTVTKTGSGSGTVTSVPPGIDCGSDCSQDYAHNTQVTLSAIPDTGSTFTGWTGDLTGTTNPATLTMDGNKTVSATFELNVVTLTINQATGGTITADPAGPYHYGDDVTLTATPAQGYAFTGWAGDLTGTTNPATLNLDGDKTVSATFTRITYYIYMPVLAK
jgi:uncharacterized repeat protein (TIGR02543 family)